MPVLNRIADFAPEMAAWRQHLHQNPELGFDCHATADFVAARLAEFGITQVHRGIAKTGLVALIEGQGAGPTIGLRADMDGLPIQEATGLAYASATPGKMHACGHDGHTAMLLGAAKYLAETRRFAGRVALIFQPAEEDGGGGGVMVEEGMLERFEIREVYALHTAPGLPLGHFETTPGPIMAAVDTFEIRLTGKGGHAAMPHQTQDPIIAAASLVQAIQTIVSRNAFALDDLVISVTQIHAGSAENIVPDQAFVGGTVRSFAPHVQELVSQRLSEICAGHETAYKVAVALNYRRWYPATINDPDKADFAARIAADIVGADRVTPNSMRQMGAEDFSYLLNARPGAYLFLGQGAGAPWHHPGFNFNDEAAPIGASFFARLIERALPL